MTRKLQLITASLIAYVLLATAWISYAGIIAR